MYTQCMHNILHSIYYQCSPPTNKFLYLFLLQPRLDYSCCSVRHTHASHLLQPTLPPLQLSICSKTILEFKFDDSPPPWLLSSSSICSRHVFCVNATHLAKNGHPTTAKIRPMNLQQYLYQGRFYLPWYSNTSFNTLLPRFCPNFKPFRHYLASQQPLTGTFIRYLCTAHIEVFDNDSSPAMDHLLMNNWSIRHLPTLPAVICTFTALDLDMYTFNFTVCQDHANLLKTYLQHPIHAD